MKDELDAESLSEGKIHQEEHMILECQSADDRSEEQPEYPKPRFDYGILTAGFDIAAHTSN